jgi:hypothetical protein
MHLDDWTRLIDMSPRENQIAWRISFPPASRVSDSFFEGLAPTMLQAIQQGSGSRSNMAIKRAASY